MSSLKNSGSNKYASDSEYLQLATLAALHAGAFFIILVIVIGIPVLFFWLTKYGGWFAIMVITNLVIAISVNQIVCSK